MLKVYPPHQDIYEDKPLVYRMIDPDALGKWIEMGWVTDPDVSSGKKERVPNAMRIEEKADQDEAEIIAGAIEVPEPEPEPEPKRRGRPRKA